ncbi:MAG: PucR family transcriptional regulator [Microbacterium sp.]
MATRPDAPTLRALLARRDLHLRLDGDADELGEGALDRPIRWVHSSDLADPTPFLSEGLALLTTGTQFQDAADDPAQYRDYVRRLSARGVVGLGFGTEVVRDGIPPGLAEACRAERMPLFEVPYRTPFIAVARAGAEAIAAQSYARRSWALAAQRAISLAALRPDGLGATLAELARQLDAWVGLYDTAGTLTREHPSSLEPAVADELRAEVGAVLRRGARAGSSLRIGGVPFSLQTLGRGGHLRGVIAMSAGELDQEGRGVVTAVVAMAGLALEQQQGLDRARTLLRAGLVHSLLGNDPVLARRVARDLWGGLPSAPFVVAMTDTGTVRRDAVREWLELRADERRGGLFFGRGDEGLVLVVAASEAGLLDEFAERFEEHLGVSDPHGYDTFSTATDQARLARDRGPMRVSHFADVARTGVLSVAPSAEARLIAEAALDPLVLHDREHGTALLETVRAWLENDCSHEASARALGVHRHTVRARIASAERVLAVDLGSFAARAEIWAALRLTS